MRELKNQVYGGIQHVLHAYQPVLSFSRGALTDTPSSFETSRSQIFPFNITNEHWSHFISKAALTTANACYKSKPLLCQIDVAVFDECAR